MDEVIAQKYKAIIINDIKRYRPEDADKAELIVEHLFTMPQLKTERDIIQFIEEYHKAVGRKVSELY